MYAEVETMKLERCSVLYYSTQDRIRCTVCTVLTHCIHPISKYQIGNLILYSLAFTAHTVKVLTAVLQVKPSKLKLFKAKLK